MSRESISSGAEESEQFRLQPHQATVHSLFWTTANPDIYELPMYSRAGFQAVTPPPIGGLYQPANPGSRTDTYREIVYYQSTGCDPEPSDLVAGTPSRDRGGQ